jgi:hypothetical protein
MLPAALYDPHDAATKAAAAEDWQHTGAGQAPGAAGEPPAGQQEEEKRKRKRRRLLFLLCCLLLLLLLGGGIGLLAFREWAWPAYQSWLLSLPTLGQALICGQQPSQHVELCFCRAQCCTCMAVFAGWVHGLTGAKPGLGHRESANLASGRRVRIAGCLSPRGARQLAKTLWGS